MVGNTQIAFSSLSRICYRNIILLYHYHIIFLKNNLSFSKVTSKRDSVISLVFAFIYCVFSDVSSNGLPEKRHIHIGCICLTFLHCVFSDVYSNRLSERMHNHICYISLTFLHCVFSNVSLNCLLVRMQSQIGCIYLS